MLEKNIEKSGSQASRGQGSAPEASIEPPEAPQVVPGGWQNFRFFWRVDPVAATGCGASFSTLGPRSYCILF